MLVYKKYKALDNRTIEMYIIYYGKDEGEYYRNDYFTGKHGIRAKMKEVINGVKTRYCDWCCTHALTKKDVIREELGGNGYTEGYVPDITIKDLETGNVFNACDYMKTNNLTKFEGGWDNAEKYFEFMYRKEIPDESK